MKDLLKFPSVPLLFLKTTPPSLLNQMVDLNEEKDVLAFLLQYAKALQISEPPTKSLMLTSSFKLSTVENVFVRDTITRSSTTDDWPIRYGYIPGRLFSSIGAIIEASLELMKDPN